MESPEDYADRIYSQTMDSLQRRYESPEFNLAAVEAEYEALCVYQGHGMDGRNFYKDAEIDGQIDAFQVFLHRIKTDSSEN